MPCRVSDDQSLLLGGGGGGGGFTFCGGGGFTLAPSLIDLSSDGLGGGGFELFLPILNLPRFFHKFNPLNIIYVY